MNRPHEILLGQLCLAVLAAAFCVWSASGNEVNLCVTAGCSLFQDTTVAGISLWWLGAGMFALLALLALTGAAHLGRFFSALALLGDVGLLLLMAITAPCVSCLLVAIFYALLYSGFRNAVFRANTAAPGGKPGRSALLMLWGLLFIVNVGAAARTQAEVWPITDNSAEATVRMFFSPSCPSCQEGISLLSGHVDVAFYPLADNEADIYRVARMKRLLDSGAGVAEALAKAQDVTAPTGMSALSPEIMLLRLRMLRNKAHVFMAGAQTVPFFEYHGLPTMLVKQGKPRAAQNAPAPQQAPPAAGNAELPLDSQISGQCSGAVPCP